jgi:hypothetical protein
VNLLLWIFPAGLAVKKLYHKVIILQKDLLENLPTSLSPLFFFSSTLSAPQQPTVARGATSRQTTFFFSLAQAMLKEVTTSLRHRRRNPGNVAP